MGNNIYIIKISFLLSIVLLTLNTSEQILCSENSTLLEIRGDVVLTVFVNVNYGQCCNVSSSKGLQQISTILYIVQTLNKYEYIPGVKLGLRIFDTCHDRITVFRQVLRVAIEQSYTPDYEMGVLVPSQYGHMMDYFRDYGDLPIGIYEERDFKMPMIDILAHYLSTRYQIVDLVHTSDSTDSILDRFLEVTKDIGVCVKRSDKDINSDRYTNVTEIVIVAIGKKNDVLRWLGQNEENKKSRNSRETWFLLLLDNLDIDDLIPFGSYVIKPEIPHFDLGEFSSTGKFLENSDNLANHSPYLLDIGKAIIGLAEVFQNVRKRTYLIDNDESSIVTQSSKTQREIRDFDVYEILHMQPRSHSVRYVVATKMQHELIDIAFYEVEVFKLRVVPKRLMSKKPGLCLEHLVEKCENCTNFQERSGAHDVTKVNVVGKSFLKNNIYVPIFLIAVVCGTLACCVMIIFIVHRFATEKLLDSNTVPTIVLVLANMFTLLTALPFCVMDDYFGAENLNAWKIFLTTLAFGLTFSIMFSRALFLALSTDSVFIIHINGYLQSLMTLFMYGVQIAMSVMFFILSTMNSAIVARSFIFIALLGYDIFLLIGLFVTCYCIIRTQRNYEEKYFFGTAVGLLLSWVIWLMCFMLMQPENRDVIVFFGTVATAYLIIFGVLIPRIYYMVTHTPRRKNSGQRFDPANLPTNSIVNTIVRQSCSSYDYVHPTRESQVLRVPSIYPNYYGNSSPNSKYFERCGSLNHYEMPVYSNYEYHTEIKEIDTTYVSPQMYIGNAESLTTNDVIYTEPKIYKSQRIILGQRSNAEIICNRDNSSPSPKLHVEIYPMRYTSPTNLARERRIGKEEKGEEDEEDDKDQEECTSRVTRF